MLHYILFTQFFIYVKLSTYSITKSEKGVSYFSRARAVKRNRLIEIDKNLHWKLNVHLFTRNTYCKYIWYKLEYNGVFLSKVDNIVQIVYAKGKFLAFCYNFQ